MHLHDAEVITYTEFIAAVVNPEFFYDDYHLKMTFKRFDNEGTGNITYQNIEDCFARFGFELEDDDINGFIKDFTLCS